MKHTLNWFVRTRDSDKANRHKNTDRADFQEALKNVGAWQNLDGHDLSRLNNGMSFKPSI